MWLEFGPKMVHLINTNADNNDDDGDDNNNNNGAFKL